MTEECAQVSPKALAGDMVTGPGTRVHCKKNSATQGCQYPRPCPCPPPQNTHTHTHPCTQPLTFRLRLPL
jgi:hypothetical protein